MKLQKCALWYFYAFSPYIWQHLVTSPHIGLMRQTFMWPMNRVSLLYFYLNHIGLWHTHFTRSSINAHCISYVSGKQFKWILSDLNIGGELSKRVFKAECRCFQSGLSNKEVSSGQCINIRYCFTRAVRQKIVWCWISAPLHHTVNRIILPARVWAFTVAFWDHGDHISEGLLLFFLSCTKRQNKNHG